MTTILQGGTTTQERVRVGVAGEIRHDTSNKSVRLHDGSTPGGTELLGRTALDALYAAKTLDLAALANPTDTDLGILVRTGEGAYRYRSIVGNAQNLTVQNPKGAAGNVILGLAATISSAHEFTSAITFSGGLAGVLTGSLVGNVTGNVTGNLTGNVLGNVVGSIDARSGTIQVADAALPIAAIDGLAAALASKQGALPAGMIMLWAGSVEAIPSGWALCNGSNGTPDLTDRFVIGAGDELDPGATGGTATHTHTATAADGGAHAHPVTVAGHVLTTQEMPAHTHSTGVTDNSQTDVFNRGSVAASPTTPNAIESNSADGIYEGVSSSTGGGAAHAHSASSGNAGTHSHTLTVAAQNNLPPYYALCYIMKV